MFWDPLAELDPVAVDTAWGDVLEAFPRTRLGFCDFSAPSGAQGRALSPMSGMPPADLPSGASFFGRLNQEFQVFCSRNLNHWSTVSTSTPNIQCAITLASPRTRR